MTSVLEVSKKNDMTEVAHANTSYVKQENEMIAWEREIDVRSVRL